MQGNSFARDTWNAATELLRAEGKLSDSQIAFVRLAQPLAIAEDKFLLGAGSDFVKTWLLEHVGEVMSRQLSKILGHNISLQISVDPTFSEQDQRNTNSPENEPHEEPQQTPTSQLPTKQSSQQQPQIHTAENLDSYFSAHSFSSANTANNSLNISESTQTAPKSPENTYFPAPQFEQTTSHFEQTNFAQSTSQRDYDASHYQNSDDYSSVAHDYFSQEPKFDYPQQTFESGEPSGINQLPDAAPSGLTLPRTPSITSLQAQARLNPRYTFDTFVIGESNRFAHATALAVSEAPGSTYNPLFLYSDSGMGKTHLLHAIGNYTVSLYPNKKVLYISSEEFTNAFINALRDKTIYSFKDQFRNIDVLLIDDIQFITNLAATSEEFFHTFNALSNANKQIVITSDVAPKLLQGFEERMISRFASGITASIDLPNLETRIAILEKKSAAEGLHVPRDVIEFIASKMTTNVREMEGALRRIAAFADLSRQPVTLEMAQLVLKDMITDRESVQVTAGTIMAQTASYFDISLEDLKSPVRTRSFTMPRHIAMYLCREMTDYSLPKIAELFDRRDHTTVLNALRKVEKQMTEKQTVFNQVTELTARIKNAAKEQAQQ